jgi:hypothetical protein
MDTKSAVEWWKSQAKDVFEQAVFAELYSYRLFEIEDRRYYSFQSNEIGDSVWLIQLNQKYKVKRFEEALKLSGQVRPVPCTFSHHVPIPLTWLEDGEIKRIENELRQGGKDFAQKINQAFVDVLMASVENEARAQNEELDKLLAQIFDDLVVEGFTAKVFLFPQRFKGKLLVQEIITPSKEIQNEHYVGETITGQQAFWSDELPDDVALIFDSTAGVTITQDSNFWLAQQPGLALAACGKIRLNFIVKDTQAIIALEGIEQALARRASGKVPTRQTKTEISMLSNVPFLSQSDILDAQEMSELYVILHCYENSVRRFVEAVLLAELGTDWWDKAANTQMKRHLEGRKKQEEKKKWISPRGQKSPLYYLEWGDLVKLIRKYENIFVPHIGELRFVENRFADLESLRNIVAHHGTLPSSDDFQRVQISFRDWCRQVGDDSQ